MIGSVELTTATELAPCRYRNDQLKAARRLRNVGKPRAEHALLAGQLLKRYRRCGGGGAQILAGKPQTPGRSIATVWAHQAAGSSRCTGRCQVGCTEPITAASAPRALRSANGTAASSALRGKPVAVDGLDQAAAAEVGLDHRRHLLGVGVGAAKPSHSDGICWHQRRRCRWSTGRACAGDKQRSEREETGES